MKYRYIFGSDAQLSEIRECGLLTVDEYPTLITARAEDTYDKTARDYLAAAQSIHPWPGPIVACRYESKAEQNGLLITLFFVSEVLLA